MIQVHETHLPLAPLLAAMGDVNQSAAARRLRVSRRTVCRWARDGIPARRADELAVRVDRHPVEIWGPTWGLPVEAWRDWYSDMARRRAVGDFARKGAKKATVVD